MTKTYHIDAEVLEIGFDAAKSVPTLCGLEVYFMESRASSWYEDVRGEKYTTFTFCDYCTLLYFQKESEECQQLDT